MKMQAFLALSQTKQLGLLYKCGTYLGKRKLGSFSLVLYQFEAFYVEITYSIYRVQVNHIQYSEATSILDPYLEQIHIEELIKS